MPSHIICVGAVYIDTILSVPHFPLEDQKLRATNLIRRRGGNTANTLEVISQLLPASNLDSETLTYATELSLLSVLPDERSPDTQLVIRSLPDVSTRLFQYRPGEQVAASSYIFQSAEKSTRTIVSANPLRELSVQEFIDAVEPVIPLGDYPADVWIHFEGRVPEVLLPCVQWLRRLFGFHGKVRISVECEKPDRVGMVEVAALADVVFYSRLWAEANNHTTAESFLESQIPLTSPNATLICTWGSTGASAVRKSNGSIAKAESVGGWHPTPASHFSPSFSPTTTATPKEAIDTVGAGDTFIAGMLYALVQQKKWGLAERLAFANELAGRKVYREGFAGLGEVMRGTERWGEGMGGSSSEGE